MHIYNIYWSFLNTILFPISFWLLPPFLHPNFTSYFYNSLSYPCCLSVHGCRDSHRSNLTTAMPLERNDSSYQIFQLSKLLIEEKEFHEPLQIYAGTVTGFISHRRCACTSSSRLQWSLYPEGTASQQSYSAISYHLPCSPQCSLNHASEESDIDPFGTEHYIASHSFHSVNHDSQDSLLSIGGGS